MDRDLCPAAPGGSCVAPLRDPRINPQPGDWLRLTAPSGALFVAVTRLRYLGGEPYVHYDVIDERGLQWPSESVLPVPLWRWPAYFKDAPVMPPGGFSGHFHAPKEKP